MHLITMNKAIAQQYSKELRQIVRQFDPIQLIRSGAPEDEYDGEAQLISGPLLRCATANECLTLVHQVFCDAFDLASAGSREKYGPLAQTLWRLRETYS